MGTMNDVFGNAFAVGKRVAYSGVRNYDTPDLNTGVITEIDSDANTVTLTDDYYGPGVTVDASLAVTTV